MEKDSKQKLLESAALLFAQKGYAGVSIREISQAAAVNSSLISYYFGGKEGLYAALFEKMFGNLLASLQAINFQNLAPDERIKLFAKTISQFHRETPCLLRLMQSELLNPSGSFNDIVDKHMTHLVKSLSSAITEGCAAGQFKQHIYPPYAAMILAGIINFYLISRPVREKLFPTDQDHDELYIEQALSIYFDGLRRQKHE